MIKYEKLFLFYKNKYITIIIIYILHKHFFIILNFSFTCFNYILLNNNEAKEIIIDDIYYIIYIIKKFYSNKISIILFFI